jgi:hypothetical protein
MAEQKANFRFGWKHNLPFVPKNMLIAVFYLEPDLANKVIESASAIKVFLALGGKPEYANCLVAEMRL